MGGTWQSAWELVSTQWMFLFVMQMATVRLPLTLIDLEKSVSGRWQSFPPSPRMLIEWQNQVAGKIPLLTECSRYILGYLSTLLLTILVVAFFLPTPSPESCDSTQGGGRAASHGTPSSWLQWLVQGEVICLELDQRASLGFFIWSREESS